jgi:hypothetical protein
MSDRDLFDAVARKTGEDSHEIARRGGSSPAPIGGPRVQTPAPRRTWPGPGLASGLWQRADGEF